MKLLINHLTRMQQGFMCTAGIDLETMRHVRPVIQGMLPIDLLTVHGGPLELRRVIDPGPTEFAGRIPEIEDRLFKPESVTVLEVLDKQQFLAIQEQVAADSLASIFGKDLQPIHYDSMPPTAAVAERRGLRSLGCYWASEPEIEAQHYAGRTRVRFQFTEAGVRFSVPVTDIRCYGTDHVTPDVPRIQELQRHLKLLQRVLTSIGLSRAYRRSSAIEPMHWLQINNIHLPA